MVDIIPIIKTWIYALKNHEIFINAPNLQLNTRK